MRLRWMLTGLLALAMVMAISPALAQDAAEEETAVDPDVQAELDEPLAGERFEGRAIDASGAEDLDVHELLLAFGEGVQRMALKR